MAATPVGPDDRYRCPSTGSPTASTSQAACSGGCEEVVMEEYVGRAGVAQNTGTSDFARPESAFDSLRERQVHP